MIGENRMWPKNRAISARTIYKPLRKRVKKGGTSWVGMMTKADKKKLRRGNQLRVGEVVQGSDRNTEKRRAEEGEEKRLS